LNEPTGDPFGMAWNFTSVVVLPDQTGHAA
jgi:hypothetical protein